MIDKRNKNRESSGKFFFLKFLTGIALVICILLIVYQPDRPVANIVPGTSSGPAFVVQVIRPRLGLPVGGLLPPQFFGLEGYLGFDSTSPGATICSFRPNRIELGANTWELVLAFDGNGGVAPETHITFELIFEDKLQRVRCWPGDPAIGKIVTSILDESGQVSGQFDIELGRCEDAETGKPLGWPPSPLVLHGSFDRLPLGD